MYVAYIPNEYISNSLSTNWPTTPDQFMALPWSMMIPMTELCSEPMIFPAKRIDPGSLRFRNLSGPGVPVTLEVSDGWGSFVFFLVGGGNAATTISIEYVSRTEMTPQPTASIVSSGTSYPTNTNLMDKVANVQSAMPLGYIDSGDPGFLQGVINEASARFGAMWNGAKYNIGRGLVAGAATVGGTAAVNFVRALNRLNRPRLM